MKMAKELELPAFLPKPLKKTKVEIPSLPDIVLPRVLPQRMDDATDRKAGACNLSRSLSSSTGASVGMKRPNSQTMASLEDAIVSKRTMPKLYSRKMKMSDGSIIGGVPRLVDLCLKVLCNHIDSIDEVGDLPYFVLKGVLDRCSPVQLMRIESLNPHLIEDTDQLWESFCKKEFKMVLDTKPDEESWCEYYVRLCQQRDHKLELLKMKVAEHIVQSESPKRKTKLTCAVNKPVARKRASQTPNTTSAPLLRESYANTFGSLKAPTTPMWSKPFSPAWHQTTQGISAAKRVRTVMPEEPAIVIPSRAEILAKRGLKTLTDPRMFKNQLVSSTCSSSSRKDKVKPAETFRATLKSSCSRPLMPGVSDKSVKLATSSSIAIPKKVMYGTGEQRIECFGKKVTEWLRNETFEVNPVSSFSKMTETRKKDTQPQQLSSKDNFSRSVSSVKLKTANKSNSTEFKPRKRTFDC